MVRLFPLAAFAAAALLVTSSHLAKAASLGIEGGDNGGATLTATDFDITDGVTFDPSTTDPEPYTFTFTLELQPGYKTQDLGGGESEITGTYAGDYTFSNGAINISTGTLSADADFYDYNGVDFYLNLSNGLLNQTSGTGFDIFPAGTSSYSLNGLGFTEAAIFDGTIAPAVSSVPLPSSVSMGLLLCGGLLPLAIRRRAKLAAASI